MTMQRLVGLAQVTLGPLVPPAADTRALPQVPPVAELLVQGYDGTVYLPTTTERGQIIARVVDLLVQERLNIYFEIDGGQLLDVSVPIVGGVRDLISSPSGDVLVVLERSPTPLVVRADHPDRESILRTLARAVIDPLAGVAQETVAVVTRLPCTEVSFVQAMGAPTRKAPEPGQGRERELDEHLLEAANLSDLDDFVVEQRQLACSVKWPEARCVPHTFVCDYCYLRAHEMCLKLKARGFRPRKLWMYARSVSNTIRVPTDLLPDCKTNWLFHVVTIVTSKQDGVRVIDPSLFPGGTVSEQDYLEFINPDPDCVERTPMAAYIKQCGEPATETTAEGLREDRANAIAALVATLKEPAGPPPYRDCQLE